MRIGKMVKFWKYYKYYFCTLWKRPLVWLLTGGMIYAQYEQDWQIQAMIYVGFVLLLPLAVACERVRADYELEDIANDLAERDARREANRRGQPPVAETVAETPEETEDLFNDHEHPTGGLSETFGFSDAETDDAERD
jgi:hypothetical protein